MLYVTSDEYGYFETIQAFFLEMTGKGLVLSSRDIDALLKWQQAGATAATVCTGIARAIEAKAKKPRDIWACRKWIEPLVMTARSKAVDVTVGSQPNSVVETIETAAEHADRDAFRQAYRDAANRLRAAEAHDMWDAMVSADATLVQAFLNALSNEELALMNSRINDDPTLSAMSPEARAQHLRARTKRMLKDLYGLVSPVDL